MKIICIGWNYRPHLKELNGPLPEVPLVFLKPSTCIVHDGDEIIIPKGYLLTDLMDTDDTGYGYEDEAVYTGEVSVQFE